MKVNECMCTNICTCKPDTRISDVAKIMNKNNVGCIPVCNDDNCIVGIITDRDIILRSVACGKDVNTTKASDIMTSNTISCDCNDEINTVTRSMGNTGIRRIPVTQNGKVVGIITLGDLAKHQGIACECIGNTFENICKCNNNLF